MPPSFPSGPRPPPRPASRQGKALETRQLPPRSLRRCERCVDYSHFCRAYTPLRPAAPHFARTRALRGPALCAQGHRAPHPKNTLLG